MAGREKFDDGFEKEWRDAMDGIERTPPSTVWNEIDRHLAYEELAMYKTRVFYYKWTAAAVILMAAFTGLILFLSGDGLTSQQNYAEVVDVDGPLDQSYGFSLQVPLYEKEEDTSAKIVAISSGKESIEKPGTGGEVPNSIIEMNRFTELELEKLNPGFTLAANHEEKELFKVPIYNFNSKKKKRENNEKYWAGIGLSRGTFEPNFVSGGNTFMPDQASAASFSQANNEALDRNAPEVRESMSAGGTVALGLNVGFKVGSRWTLESGVQYTRSDATTTTNVVIETTTIREIIPASSEMKNIPQVQRAISEEKVIEYNYQDVDLSNQFQFATVPVKAGYLIIDSKFKFEVNAGVAANVYLGNKLTANDDQMADVTFGPGDTSPYREMSFSGLAGVQLGYEFFDKFDLVIEPNYRQSINSLTKDNSTFTSNPSGFGVMTGIRYRFD